MAQLLRKKLSVLTLLFIGTVSIFVLLLSPAVIGGEENESDSNSKDDESTMLSSPPYYTAFDSASWAITQPQLSMVLSTGARSGVPHHSGSSLSSSIKSKLKSLVQKNQNRNHKQMLYDEFIERCDIAHNKSGRSKWCANQDEHRMRMNRNQPSSVYNYTKLGYAKTRVPTELYDEIKAYFDENKHKAEIEWKEYNVYHNAWDSPPTILHINKNPRLKARIEATIQPILERWTGNHLYPVSTYGIRLYHNDSILTPHVDRFPLVTSVIIQVDQDIDEDWPLEVYGHDGRATNVTMEPGDMVLYESHSVIHGRPFPMRGNYFANAFIHFEPYAPIIQNDNNIETNNDDDNTNFINKMDNSKKDNDGVRIPPYLIKDSDWANEWKKSHPNGWGDSFRTLLQRGNMNEVQTVAKIMGPELINQQDDNGWTILHEMARSGNPKMIQMLLNHGGDPFIETNYGQTPLDIAKQHDQHQAVILFRNYMKYVKKKEEQDNNDDKDDRDEL